MVNSSRYYYMTSMLTLCVFLDSNYYLYSARLNVTISLSLYIYLLTQLFPTIIDTYRILVHVSMNHLNNCLLGTRRFARKSEGEISGKIYVTSVSIIHDLYDTKVNNNIMVYVSFVSRSELYELFILLLPNNYFNSYKTFYILLL